MLKKLFSFFQKNILSYFGLLCFFAVLTASWFYFYYDSKQEVSEVVHGVLQEKFQSVVADYVEVHYPEVEHISFHKIWTENTESIHKLKIYFSYTLDISQKEAAGKVLIDGEAFLIRSRDQQWLVKDFKVSDSYLEFSTPLVIKASVAK